MSQIGFVLAFYIGPDNRSYPPNIYYIQGKYVASNDYHNIFVYVKIRRIWELFGWKKPGFYIQF